MPNPNIKYHYTSVDGMASIFSNHHLRLTRSEFLNDPADCRVLFTLIEKYLTYKHADIEVLLTTPELRQVYEKAPLINYIAFLQKHIHLYVLSLTDNIDQMSMWNYYGSGGMQLSIDIEQLIKEISKSLVGSNQYLAYSSVKYISDTDTVSTTSFDAFSSFHLDKKDKENIFLKNSKIPGRTGGVHPLYQTTELAGFIDTYITGYIASLEFLLSAKANRISPANSDVEIFTAVHGNTNSLNNYYEFKKDLTLYMIVLSALIKNDTYSFEKEFRIVCFENALSPTINVKYSIQTVQGQKYMRPYMETSTLDTSFIKGVTLSPLTRNIPIDNNLYSEIISEFIKKVTGAFTSTDWSKHSIRW